MSSPQSLLRTLGMLTMAAGLVSPSAAGADTGVQQHARAAFNGCSGCTIEHANFAGANLARLRLDGVTLRDVDLSGADLTGARLEGVTLIGVRLDRAILSRARFDGSEVSTTSFRNARLDGAQFQGVTFEHNVFAGARMRGVGVYGSRLVASDLRDADLSGANVASSDLARSDLRGANLTRTVLCERANENTTGPGGEKHGRVTQCVGLQDADVQGVQFGAALSCDGSHCVPVDPVQMRKRSDTSA